MHTSSFQHLSSSLPLQVLPTLIHLIFPRYLTYLPVFRYRQSLASPLHPALRLSPSSRVLLVLAHPDDEAMFFVPSIARLLAASAQVHLLCLSTGNYDGLGATRSLEVSAAARILGLSSCTVLDDAQLQDGPANSWPPTVVAGRISEAAARVDATHIFTFDAGGISAHANHVDTHKGCVAFARSRPQVHLLTLNTSPLLVKYLGVFALLFPPRSPGHLQHVSRMSNRQPFLVARAMRAHRSQLTWFRWLFIVFSHYTYFNDVVVMRA
jgi:N-acetylglucosaminylphosphatidylinositol deacetylase